MKLKQQDKSAPKPMEVWNVNVQFDDGGGSKNRPAIVLGKSGSDLVVFMVTSHGHRPETDIKLIDPWTVMLDKGSIVRTDRTFKVQMSKFNYKLGDLCGDDCEMVEMFYERVKNKPVKTNYVRS